MKTHFCLANVAILGISFLGCRKNVTVSNPQSSSSSVTSNQVEHLSVQGPSALYPGICSVLQVTITDANGQMLSLPRATDIEVLPTGSILSYASNSLCNHASSIFTIPAGTSSLKIPVISTATGVNTAQLRFLRSDGTALANIKFSAATAASGSGTLDAQFNGAGWKRLNFAALNSAFPKGYDGAESVASSATGSIFIFGTSTLNTLPFTGQTQIAISKLQIDGTLDTTFNTSGMVGTLVPDFSIENVRGALQVDGKLLVAATATKNNQKELIVLRYLANGSFDSAFGNAGIVHTSSFVPDSSTLGDLAIQQDGKILIAGTNIPGSGISQIVLLRLNSNGTPDTSFGSGSLVLRGFGTNASTANRLALQSAGKIILGGAYNNGTDNDFLFVRFQANGLLDTSFASSGSKVVSFGKDEKIEDLSIDHLDRIVGVGYLVNGYTAQYGVVRLSSEGDADLSFNTSGQYISPPSILVGNTGGMPLSLSLSLQGSLFLVGQLGNIGGTRNAGIIKLTEAGVLDTSFNGTGIYENHFNTTSDWDIFRASTLLPDGRLVGVGHTTQWDGVEQGWDHLIARFF